MAKRSLKASSTGQQIARQALERTQWTQEQLAYEVGLNTRQSVWKFLTGRPVERHIFIDLCFHLNLDWQDIADLPRLEKTAAPADEATSREDASARDVPPPPADSETWVSQLREYLKPAIVNQCGVMQSSLDLGRPLALELLYTPIRIVPQVLSQQWLDVDDLQPVSKHRRLRLAKAHPESVDAMTFVQQKSRVLLLGKPGAGKTTFLKYLASQCMAGKYRPDCVPLFIKLRHSLLTPPLHPTAEGSSRLMAAIASLATGAGLPTEQLQALLHQGRLLLLLDGLDEVPESHLDGLLQDIQYVVRLYPKNPCLISSRINSQLPYLPGFLDVEVDDFSRDQVEIFVNRWFAANFPDPAVAQTKVEAFLVALDKEDNQPLKELVATPILLSLLCSVFLARSNFPKQRAKLYHAGLDILLQQWDQARGIRRDHPYRILSVAEKLTLLGTIASTTFERQQYFFEKSTLLEIIANHLQTLGDRDAASDLETLYLESETILEAIQVQHGLIVERAKDVYSFSHLTFQEYLTARKILYQTTPEALTQTVAELATHTLQPNWHEVLCLSSSMMSVADSLLMAMYQVIQTTIAGEPDCLQLLSEIAHKAATIQSGYRPAAVRAFYMTLFSDRDLKLATALDEAIGQRLPPEMAIDLVLARAYELAVDLLREPAFEPMLNLIFALQLESKFSLSPAFQTALVALKQQLPDVECETATLTCWWQGKGVQWVEQLQKLLVEHRQIAQMRRLSRDQRSLMRQYYQLHVFWMDCLHKSHTSEQFAQNQTGGLLLPPVLSYNI